MHKLEKLNSSIDIIPLQSSSMMDNNAARRSIKPTQPQPRVDEAAAAGRIFRDPMIISRVRTYLYENEDKVYIDVTEMADYLQRKYRDYRGKKRGPFRAMVRRAYDEITENLTRQADTHWNDDEDEIDIEVDAMPSEYLATYKRPSTGRQNGNSSDKELIDISSDDEQTSKTTFPTTASSTSYRLDRESMEAEPMQVSKRPHLCSSIEPVSRTTVVQQTQQSHEMPMDVQKSSNRTEKSRKRPREKDNASPFDVLNNKKKPRDMPVVNPTVKFSDVGGNTKVLETVANLLVHMKHPEVYTKLGISPPRGFLLHGPPGCGKTLLAHAIAGELQMPLLKVAAPELVAGVSGESEQRIRELFDQAIAIAPCILFLDEIDAVAPHRANAQREMERRIVAQLLSCLDELGSKTNGNKVLVLGATNRPDSLDPALRRAGRFDREVSLGIPDKDARTAILKVHTANVTLSNEVSLENIASLTPGFVGADLVALIREAAMAAVNRTFDDLKKSAAVKVNPVEPSPNEVSVAEIEIEEEKPVLTEVPQEPKVPEVADVIVEEETPSNTDTATEAKSVNQTEDILEEQSKSITEEVETQEKTEEKPESSEPENVPDRPPVPPTPAPTAPIEGPQPEPAASTPPDITDVPISSASNLPCTVSTTEAVPVSTEVKTEDEPEMNMQIVEEPGKKLMDILSWLHNEPPLTTEQLALLCVEEQDFDVALKSVQPSAKREGFATVPDVTWDDIGSLQDIRQELQMTILAPIRHSEQFASLGLTTPTGVLLCGPPGCGKTLLAKAIANEAGINFISVKGPELLNMYVGESEKAVRQCFMRARNSAPCVIFFDELDALCPKRSEGDSSATSRVVNQMLTEMDGVEGRKDVFLMAASNRPDIIDPAVLRPGRLDKILYVGLPCASDRVDILRALTKNGTRPKLAADVSLEDVGRSDRCEGYTGADLAAFVREAGVEALREIMSGLPGSAEICARHLAAAFDKIRPSVSEKDMRHYEVLKKLYSVKKSLNTDVPMILESPIDTTMEAMET
ncbi:nuclear valosin-containing protein-like isoform X3 [Nasonia vitripennis]|uniref:AAA+ ATPase domain-containing protein n=1 Tax=Nasonia vitripennis TaxID=7425 RepID=A0A7M7M2C6_NASVI|nr:nuclear valosin-containing protein-like isoform X3 [Nasonia vitripennis]